MKNLLLIGLALAFTQMSQPANAKVYMPWTECKSAATATSVAKAIVIAQEQLGRNKCDEKFESYFIEIQDVADSYPSSRSNSRLSEFVFWAKDEGVVSSARAKYLDESMASCGIPSEVNSVSSAVKALRNQTTKDTCDTQMRLNFDSYFANLDEMADNSQSSTDEDILSAFVAWTKKQGYISSGDAKSYQERIGTCSFDVGQGSPVRMTRELKARASRQECKQDLKEQFDSVFDAVLSSYKSSPSAQNDRAISAFLVWSRDNNIIVDADIPYFDNMIGKCGFPEAGLSVEETISKLKAQVGRTRCKKQMKANFDNHFDELMLTGIAAGNASNPKQIGAFLRWAHSQEIITQREVQEKYTENFGSTLKTFAHLTMNNDLDTVCPKYKMYARRAEAEVSAKFQASDEIAPGNVQMEKNFKIANETWKMQKDYYQVNCPLVGYEIDE